MKGCCADTVEPYIGANFWKDWEKLANIEMYETDGSICFNQKVGINLFGGFSRMLPQKSLAIFARSRYGKNRIEYPIFPERDIKEYKSFIIRNSGGDFRRTHFRDAFMTQLAAPTGVAIQAYRPAIIFLNGEYWGIQNLREKISEHYLKDNFDVDKKNVDILRHNGVARHGTSANYKRLLRFLRTKDMSQDETVNQLRVFMDIEDYIRYNIAETYSDNRDAGGNIRYWRERKDSAKWRWVLYDLDLGLGNNEPKGYMRNTVKKFTSANAEIWPDPAWSTFIIRSLLKNKKLETQYINTFADHLNTVYKEETALALIEEIKGNIAEEMQFHVKKWKTSYENWEYHVEIVKTFVKERPTYLRKYIAEKFDLDGTIRVNIKHPGKERGKVRFNSLKIKTDFEGVYFKNVPITISVETPHDYVFKGWKGYDDSSTTFTISPQNNIVLEPIIEPRVRSVHSDSIKFSEFSLYQTDSDTTEDWVELLNNSTKEIDLSNWRFTDGEYEDGFSIPNGTKLPPKGYLILSQRITNYSAFFNTDTIQVIGDFEFGLSKEKGKLKLYDGLGSIADSLSYEYGEDWPDSLVTQSLINPDSTGEHIEHWKRESPTPGEMSESYADYLEDEAEKRYWTKIYYIGGGSFFFIFVGGLLLRRSIKRRKKKQVSKEEEE